MSALVLPTVSGLGSYYASSLADVPVEQRDGDPANIDTDLGSIVMRAILFLAPLLPLLATSLCEDRVVRALDLGLLYPAAAPMSIFGCLGIAKAGFIALCASIDRDVFDGPALLRDAGFRPSGMGELLLHLKESKQHLYLGEDRLRAILSKKKVRSVDVNLQSPDLLAWNARLLTWTAFLSIFGILPYIPLFIYSLPDKPFRETWLYPILRISGSAIVAISIQLLFQLRLLEEVYYRLRFLAADTYLKDAGVSLPPFWDHNQRSKDTFADLERWISDPNRRMEHPQDRELSDADAAKFLLHINSLSSFDFSTHTQEAIDDPQTPLGSPHCLRPIAQYATTIILWLTQLLLLFGVACIIIGYIGCFGVVIASGGTTVWWGPLSWLLCEGALLLVRMVVWALNPKWDDPRSPIVLAKSDAALSPGDRNKCSYGVGWGLKSVTADDMHALIIGINEYPPRTGDGLTSLTGALPDAKRVRKYLQETLLVPCSQICTLYDREATKERIVEELKALRHRGSVSQNAPIVIYYAGHSIRQDRNAYLVPYPPNIQKRDQEAEEKDLLAYSELVDLLTHIGDEKTENIVNFPSTWAFVVVLTYFPGVYPRHLPCRRIGQERSFQ